MRADSQHEREGFRDGAQFFKPAEKRHARDVKCLTSLRFFAAAWVLALHFTNEMPLQLEGVTSFFTNGRMGVDFFFVLSGFILTHVYISSLEQERFGFLRFVQKRLARLYPLHVACILLVALYLAAGAIVGVYVSNPEVYSLQRLWPNLLLLHAWGTLDGMSWNYVSWSISAEWFAYLLFLPLSLLFTRWRAPSLTKLLVSLLFLFAMITLAPPLIGRDLTHLTHDFGILRILPEFTLGIALYHASRDHDIDPVRGPWMLLSAVLALILVAHFDLGGMWAVSLLAFVIFASASLERQGRLGFLGNRVLIYLGETSYSLYMLHAIVFIVYFRGLGIVFGDSLDAWIWYVGPLVIPLSLAAASIGYHFVEVPCRHWITEKVDLEALFRWRSAGKAGEAR
ncbi:MAG: acyltransferase [Geminicoccaceae bacterium]